jgi:hypothetical protein
VVVVELELDRKMLKEPFLFPFPFPFGRMLRTLREGTAFGGIGWYEGDKVLVQR